MAMATSTFSPRPATLNKPLRAGIQLHLIPFPHLRAGRLVCATAAGEAPPVEVGSGTRRSRPPPRPPTGPPSRPRRPPRKPSPRRSRPSATPEARRRKWLEDYPEATSTDEAVVFDTSIIPWWAWMKRFHLPEAEKLNGRAAMVGFFMAYFVDSLTGVGLVDQMGNFFCKTLLFVAVSGVLLIRKNEDIESLKKLIDETTFYDKQWQATWQEDSTGGPKN
ncbi:unnamed protein product [Miscanthus lutarioriparius]|uniref:Uncharacterized protein n=1 Tax=Miscanthus lutarioriparius TaxID=422564 RepID=A0A811PRP5_9POAL|nr:unnamed protein product [Miscanthus lutarioriparius]